MQAVGFELLLVHVLKILPCSLLGVLFQIEAKICAADILAHGLLLPAKAHRGEIFITFGCRTNIIQNSHSAFIVLSKMLDKQQFKSYSNVIAVALVDYFDRYYRSQDDPYFETR